MNKYYVIRVKAHSSWKQVVKSFDSEGEAKDFIMKHSKIGYTYSIDVRKEN